MMRRWGFALAVLAIVAGACSNSASEETEPTGSVAPTEQAMAANDELLRIPAGLADCGTTVLTSGWPTTTAFNPEVSASCIMSAVETGVPSQYAYWFRDGAGGLQGVIVRVEGPDSLLFMEYNVDEAGILTGLFEPCAGLETVGFNPPGCSG